MHIRPCVGGRALDEEVHAVAGGAATACHTKVGVYSIRAKRRSGSCSIGCANTPISAAAPSSALRPSSQATSEPAEPVGRADAQPRPRDNFRAWIFAGATLLVRDKDVVALLWKPLCQGAGPVALRLREQRTGQVDGQTSSPSRVASGLRIRSCARLRKSPLCLLFNCSKPSRGELVTTGNPQLAHGSD